nr:MAG TPA: Terminase large subunit [Crassvirales sp.]
MIEVNKYQTPLTDELLDTLPDEVKDQLFDIINNVEFVKRLISPNRGYAKDRPRDESGKIIVDLANPHILENMDYFRPTALHYEKYGTLTNLRPNANPNSAYGKWVREEKRRCWEGYVRESDGEWVTGYMYWFLNYSPIMLSKIRKGSKRADRIEALPECWEGIYWRFHCMDQASNGGIYNNFQGGQHMAELASRGKGKSYSLASILNHIFVLGENEEAHEKVKGIVTAYQKEYLTKDGVLNKFVDMANFCASNTQFPRKRLKNSLQEMTWIMGYKDAELDIEKGTQNTVLGVSSKDDESKLRGKRAAKILIEEFGTFPRLTDLYNVLLPSVQEGDIVFGQIYMLGCVCAGTKVWTLDGRNINIEDLKREDGIVGYSKLPVIKDNYVIHNNGITRESIGKVIEPVEKDCVKITLSNGNTLMCSTDHPIFVQTKSSRRLCSYKDGNKRETIFNESFVKANQLKVGDRVCECRKIDVFGNNTLFDSRLVGMLIGDGSYGNNETPKYSSEDRELLEYVKGKYDTSLSATHITKKGNIYEDIRVKGICSYLKEIGIYGQVKQAKRLPSNYQTLTRNATIDLLSGLYDTDGTFYSKGTKSYIGLTQCNIEILKEVQILWRKFGVICSIRKTNPRLSSNRKDKNPWFTLIINGADNLKLASRVLSPIVTHKKESNQEILSFFDTYVPKKIKGYDKDYLVYKVVGIEDIGKQIVYNLSACTSRTYLANNIITHNTAGDNESDFAGAQEIMYNPKGYNMYALPNVFDKFNQGRPYFVFFFPGYINRKGCYNHDGVSDVIKALIEILLNRYRVKYNSTDPNTIIKTIAEVPITPAEAIVKTGVNMFPVADLTERLGQLDSNPREYDDVYTGDLTLNNSGIVEFRPTSDMPIREFPHKDNKIEGAFEIFQMPEIDKRTGKAYNARYILGCDPYDDDESNTMSLGSVWVLDLWTDKIVAEYTGRPPFADDFFEKVRRLCLFYNGRMNYENNKKGLFAYFSRMNCTYLLTDQLEFLKDKQMIKDTGYGNKAKGTNATEAINAFARNRLRAWLLKPTTVIQVVDGEETEVDIPNLFTLRSRAFIKELINYNSEGNFDRISAAGMLMLLREDRIILYQGKVSKEKQEAANSSYLGNDPFFKRNYKQ